MMARFRDYLSLVVFSHTIFAMPFALTGFFLGVTYGDTPFSWSLLGLCILCMVFARNSAMGFNRWADRHMDALNPRTSNREIPKGIIRGNAALVFSLANAALFVGTTALINPLCLKLSPVALAVILGYSYTKRFTWLCHLILGVGLAIAPLGAYIAVTGRFDWLPVLISGIVLTWVGGFDIIYAMQDEQFDKTSGYHSIPAFFGGKVALGISTALHILTVGMILATGFAGRFGTAFWVGAAAFVLLLVYQHIIVKPNDLSRVNRAFGTTNGIASVMFALFTIIDLLVRFH